jgi:hypothetical protein
LTLRRAEAAERKDRLISLPYTCMPDVNAFHVELRDGQFVAKPKTNWGNPQTDLQRQIFEDMITLYNLLDKPNQWARQCPLLTLWHDPALLEHLLDPEASPGLRSKLKPYKRGHWGTLVVQTFLQSRVFSLKRGGKAGANGEEDDSGKASDDQPKTKESVLMPIVDFLNHDLRARGFQIAEGETSDESHLYIFQDRPVPDSDECFVVYSNLDQYTSYVNYGFMDESAPFIVSQGARLELSQGLTVRVGRNIAGAFKGKLPQKVRDLRIFMPRVHSPDKDTLAVSRLLIPGPTAPKALRRVLTVLFRSKRPDWTEKQLEAAVLDAERKLLDRNHRFHDRTAELLAAARARSDADDVPGRRRTLHDVEQLVVGMKRRLYDYIDRLDAGA